MSGGIGIVSTFGSLVPGSVRSWSSFTLHSGWPLSFRGAAHVCGLQGGYPGRCDKWQLPQEDCDEIACESGPRVGSTVEKGAG